MFDRMEIRQWEAEIAKPETRVKKHKKPRREKLKEVRKGRGLYSVHWDKECKSARKADYRKYSAEMKQLMRREQYERLHDYRRTGGWMTW